MMRLESGLFFHLLETVFYQGLFGGRLLYGLLELVDFLLQTLGRFAGFEQLLPEPLAFFVAFFYAGLQGGQLTAGGEFAIAVTEPSGEDQQKKDRNGDKCNHNSKF